MTAPPESKPVRSNRIDCLACGYDIAGLRPSGVCPECGAMLEVSFYQTVTPSAVRAVLVVKALGVLVIGLAMQWSYGNLVLAIRGTFQTWEFWQATSNVVLPVGAVAPPSPLPHVIAFAMSAVCEVALGLLLIIMGYSLLITRSRWARRLVQRVAL